MKYSICKLQCTLYRISSSTIYMYSVFHWLSVSILAVTATLPPATSRKAIDALERPWNYQLLHVCVSADRNRRVGSFGVGGNLSMCESGHKIIWQRVCKKPTCSDDLSYTTLRFSLPTVLYDMETRILRLLRSPRIDSEEPMRNVYSLAGRYDNPIPTRFLVPTDCLKIPTQGKTSKTAQDFMQSRSE